MNSKYESQKAYREAIYQEKAEAILKAAFLVFSEHGFKKASIAKIAAEGKVSPATIYKHYKDKNALFSGVMSKMWEKSAEEILRFPENISPIDALTRIGQQYTKLLMRDDVRKIFKVIIAEVHDFPELGDLLYEKGKKPYLDALEGFIRRQTQEAVFDVSNIALAARQFLGMINDVVFWPRLLVPKIYYTQQQSEEIVSEAVHTFLARYLKEIK